MGVNQLNVNVGLMQATVENSLAQLVWLTVLNVVNVAKPYLKWQLNLE